jgi:hypothetical protein
MNYVYDETTLDWLRITIPTHGFLVPIIRQKGSDKLIDGRHRLKVWEEFGGEASKFKLNVCYVETDNPEECNEIINKCRRLWASKEERQPMVKALNDRGHSQRAIARVMGEDEMTVRNDRLQRWRQTNALPTPDARRFRRACRPDVPASAERAVCSRVWA